jgi:CubicO group peptidase (beta-lactamase class C family)
MTRRPNLVMLVCALILGAIASAQVLPTAKPESVGLSPERLDRISKTVQKDIDDKRIAGAVTLAMRHGQVAWFKAQGMQDRETGKPMQPDTIFRICSMSKPITSAAVMILYEEGYFLLEDPISKYLPEFKKPRVLVKPANGGAPYTIPATREITIRDLLRHTSGLTYSWRRLKRGLRTSVPAPKSRSPTSKQPW